MNSCVFCATFCPPKFTIIGGQVKKLSAGISHKRGWQTAFNFGGKDSVIAEQLKVIFILRNILGISEDKLCAFLGSSGHLHPEYWINICLPCGDKVEKYYETVKEIGRLKKDLVKFYKDFKGLIEKSKEKEGKGPTGMLWETIRNHVLDEVGDTDHFQEKWNVEEVSPLVITAIESLSENKTESSKHQSDSAPESEWEPEPEDNQILTHIDDDEDEEGSIETERNEKRKPNNKNREKEEIRFLKCSNPNYTIFYRGTTRLHGCRKCPAINEKRNLMEQHLKLHEEGSRAIPCRKCGWFVMPNRMNFHLGLRHRLAGGKRRSGKYRKQQEYHYKCTDCNALLSRLSLYKEHEMLHETGAGEVCKDCGWLCKHMGNHKGRWHSQFENQFRPKKIKLMPKSVQNGATEVVVAEFNDVVATSPNDWNFEQKPGSSVIGVKPENLIDINETKAVAVTNSDSDPNSESEPVSEYNQNHFLNDIDDYDDDDEESSIEIQNVKGKTNEKRKRKNEGSEKKEIRFINNSNPNYTIFNRGTTRLYGCRKCPATNEKRNLMEQHLKLHENGSGAIPCPKCGWLVLPNRMGSHIGLRHRLAGGKRRSGNYSGDYHYKCPDCKALLSVMWRYKEHERLHQTGGGEICKDCGWLCKHMGNHKGRWHSGLQKSFRPRQIKLMTKSVQKGTKKVVVAKSKVEKVATAQKDLNIRRRPGSSSSVITVNPESLSEDLIDFNETKSVAVTNSDSNPDSESKPESEDNQNQVLQHSNDDDDADEENSIQNVEEKTKEKRKPSNEDSVKEKIRFVKCSNPKYTIFYRGTTRLHGCRKCPATGTSRSLMEKHLKLHEKGSGAIPCPKCRWLVMPSKMRYHYGMRHPLGGKYSEPLHYKCLDCNALLTRIGLYKDHEMLHETGGGEVCKDCGWLCKNMGNHRGRWHSDLQRSFRTRKIKLMPKSVKNGTKEVVMEESKDVKATVTALKGKPKHSKAVQLSEKQITNNVVRSVKQKPGSSVISVNPASLSNKMRNHNGMRHRLGGRKRREKLMAKAKEVDVAESQKIITKALNGMKDRLVTMNINAGEKHSNLATPSMSSSTSSTSSFSGHRSSLFLDSDDEIPSDVEVASPSVPRNHK